MGSNAKRIIMIVAVFLVLAAGLLAWNWFHVGGRELDFLDALPEDCKAVVTVQDWDQTLPEQELSKEQIRQLLDLLQGTAYWRNTSASITGNWDKNYHIFITFTIDSVPGYLSIISSGDYAIMLKSSLDIPFTNDFLHIRNKQWLAELNAILAL